MTPPPEIVRSAYAELVVTDLGRAKDFWGGLLGLHVEAEDADAVYLRGYEEFVHHSLVLRLGPVAACARIGFRVRTPEDLDHAEHFLADRGCLVKRVPAGTTLGLGEAVRAIDPLGFPIELVHHMDMDVERLVQRYDLRRGASINRLDHINVVVPDIEPAYRHYTDLDFGLSETIEEDNGHLLAAWMYRKQTVHDIAFTQGSGPALHHIAFATTESHQILGLCDTLGALGRQGHIERGPGRHGVSNAFYVYLRDPDGHRVEIYTSDYFTGDPGHPTLRWNVNDERRRDFWGNPVVERWYKEASLVLDMDGNPVTPATRNSEEHAITVGADGQGVTRS